MSLFFLALLYGCGASIQDIQVHVLEGMPTVAQVTWTTRQEVASQVRYGTSDALQWSTPRDEPTRDHSALLLGLPPSTEASFQVQAGSEESEVFNVQTGVLDDDLSRFTLEGDGWEQFMLTPLYAPDGDDGPAILDAAGRTVWQYADPRGLYVTRVRLARDGSGLIYNSSDLNGLHDRTQELVWVSWEGEETRTEQVPLMGHDFVEKADGTIVTVAFQEREEAIGTKLVEVAADGTQRDIWSSWDCFDPAVETHSEMELGWTFANALDYDENADVYTVSFRNFSSIISIDGASGECQWVFGDVAGTIDITGGTFKHEHQFERLDGGLLVFDNDGQLGQSRAIEYTFDAAAGTATEVWSYTYDAWNVVLGDVHRMDDGDTIIVWGMHGEIDRVTPEGEISAHLAADPGTVIGFTTHLDDLYIH